jgi:hypothetical protein
VTVSLRGLGVAVIDPGSGVVVDSVTGQPVTDASGAPVAPITVKTAAPYGDIRDREYNSLGMELYCWMFPEATTCKVPTVAEITRSDEYAGGQLTEENRRRATEMARQVAHDDCLTHPELYTEIPGSCSYKEPVDFSTAVLMGVGLLVGGLLLIQAMK